ncbi:choice-of-anchor D domain-containing protein [Granulicella sp. WH15]|uniref:choice-of-anchor D domain-containing protein n=1 Tax=Granulicella sp. WH15 TaxID=2602070 RepID=UPI0021065C27|nr:choice-of-anchor D domain-containing protein [Granulicella sp. WH15]
MLFDCTTLLSSAWYRRKQRLAAFIVGCVLALAAGSAWGQQLVPLQAASSRRLTANTLRTQRFLRGRSVADGHISAQALATARQQHLELAALPRASSLSAAWTPVGPVQVATAAYGNVTGRVTAIAIDPADATGNTVYVGTTGGGVWKSTNAAGPVADVHFTPLTDTLPVFDAGAGASVLPSLSIGALSLANGVLLAGTGDPNDASDSYYGGGVLRSTDGGVTWTLIQQTPIGLAGSFSFLGLSFAGFASSSTTVVAAVTQAGDAATVNAVPLSNSRMGLFYSQDAGATWQMATIMDGSQTVQSPTSSSGGGNAATSVVWNPVRKRFYAALRYHGYYESLDGITWMRLAAQPGAGLAQPACTANTGPPGEYACPLFRGALAVQPATGDMFALTTDGNNLDQGLWQDVCAPTGSGCGNATVAWGKQIGTSQLEVANGSTEIVQAGYNLELAAAPAGADTVLYAGTVDLFRCSLTAGCVWRDTTNALNGCAAPARVAPSQHALALLGGSSLLYLGNDGGLWRSTDGANESGSPCSSTDASHFDNLNGGLGSLAEVVSFAQHPTDPATLLVGLGANGTAGTGSAGTNPWTQLATGEGGTVAIDPADPSLWYLSTAAGVNIGRCANGAACTAGDFAGLATIGQAQVDNDTSETDAPWLLDPALTSNLIVGTCREWRGPAANGSQWSSSDAISSPFGDSTASSCSSTLPLVRSLAAGGVTSDATANMGSPVLYAGLAGTSDGGGGLPGHLFMTKAAATASSTTAWTDAALSSVSNDPASAGVFNPGGFDLSSVTADPHDTTGATVYATVMGFAGNGVNAPHVYRSVDFGADWTNISGNLPNAPANSLVVDPNDANTVYVAMDTGIYVTTNVSSCASTNCWTIYGSALPDSPVVGLAAAAGMAAGDGRTGELRAATYGRGIWQIPLLTALGPSAPAISLTPSSLTFASQQQSTASAPQSVTVTNTGSTAMTVSSITTSAGYAQTSDCIATPIQPGATCTVQVTFSPVATGASSGLLTVYANVPGGQGTVALNGTGTAPAAIVLTPLALTFPSTLIGSTSAVQNVTVSNTGGAPVALETPSISGPFKIAANTCGTSLPSQTGCTVSIAFAPNASGAATGTFTIADDVGIQTASLSGTGTSPATDTLAPLSLTFAAQQQGTASATQQVTLTNSGDVALTLIAATITGGDYAVVNGCGNSLNAHSSCAFSVSYTPRSIGANTGTLTVSDEFRSQQVALSGFGLAPPGVSLSPSLPLVFAAAPLGVASAAQIVTLTNNGGVPLSVGNVTVSGDFAVAAGSNTCGSTLAAGAACTLGIVFTPTGAGLRGGVLTIADSAANSPQTLALTGAGVDFTLAANGPTSMTLTGGGAGTFALLLSSPAGVPGSATFTCSGLPAYAKCMVTPSTVALGTTTTVSVAVATDVVSASVVNRKVVWLAGLLPLGLLALRRRRFAGVVLLVLIGVTGCGWGRLVPGDGTPTGPSTTPGGSSTIVVSASSAGLVRSVNLTLAVQ